MRAYQTTVKTRAIDNNITEITLFASLEKDSLENIPVANGLIVYQANFNPKTLEYTAKVIDLDVSLTEEASDFSKLDQKCFLKQIKEAALSYVNFGNSLQFEPFSLE